MKGLANTVTAHCRGLEKYSQAERTGRGESTYRTFGAKRQVNQSKVEPCLNSS